MADRSHPSAHGWDRLARGPRWVSGLGGVGSPGFALPPTSLLAPLHALLTLFPRVVVVVSRLIDVVGGVWTGFVSLVSLCCLCWLRWLKDLFAFGAWAVVGEGLGN